jgi:hypothetical protein
MSGPNSKRTDVTTDYAPLPEDYKFFPAYPVRNSNSIDLDPFFARLDSFRLSPCKPF